MRCSVEVVDVVLCQSVTKAVKKISIRFGFLVGYLRHRSPQPVGDFKNPSGTPPCTRAYGPRALRGALGIFKIPSGFGGSGRRSPLKNPNLLYIFFAYFKNGLFQWICEYISHEIISSALSSAGDFKWWILLKSPMQGIGDFAKIHQYFKR